MNATMYVAMNVPTHVTAGTANTVDAQPDGRHRQRVEPRSRVHATLSAAAFVGSIVSMLALLVFAGAAIATVGGPASTAPTNSTVQAAQ